MATRSAGGFWILDLRCNYCGGASAWISERDGKEYCPQHLFILQLKQALWEENGAWPLERSLVS